MDTQELVAELVQTRQRRGLTQKDVAEMMKVKQPSVSQFESGKMEPKMSTVERYAKAVGARVTFNLEETDNGQ